MDWLTEWWNSVVLWFLELKEDFIACFITEDRWLWLWKGLCVTLEITFAALAIGILVVDSTWRMVRLFQRRRQN